MDKPTKRKVRLILILFFVISIPMTCIVAYSYSVQLLNKSVELLSMSSDENKDALIESLKYINQSIKFNPWNYMSWMTKSQIQFKLKDYKEALISSKKGIELNNGYGEGYQFQSLIYHEIKQPEKVKYCYSKAIENYTKRLKDSPNSTYLLSNLALLYRFTDDVILSKMYLGQISKQFESPSDSLEYYRTAFYIDSYLSGGLNDFMDGKQIEIYIDNTDKLINVDSLLFIGKIFPESKIESENEITYSIRSIFTAKAEKLGFQVVK